MLSTLIIAAPNFLFLIFLAPLIQFCPSTGAASPALGNGQFENRSWQFDTPNDKIAKATLLDLREKKEGGFYDSFDVNNTFNNITNIDGDQINCNLTASAIGNSGANSASGQSSSPLIDAAGAIDSTAIGNENSNLLDGDIPYYDGFDGVAGSGHNSETGQGNENSPQDSSVTNSNISSDVNGVDASGGITEVALNSTMANEGSPQLDDGWDEFVGTK